MLVIITTINSSNKNDGGYERKMLPYFNSLPNATAKSSAIWFLGGWAGVFIEKSINLLLFAPFI
jgi:hypothetical protein